ncbi:Gfo/Idh/MocA family oxidoreductase [bacterium]|nr:Gfo/Idh/MocA family oxidoreductase [bacterium]
MESGLSEKLSIAVVGLGRIGWQFHFKQTLESDVYDLVAVVDPLEERVDEAKSASGCRGYASYEEMLASETPDVVALATPTVLHEPQTLIALERGCHVILEKPMTTSIESADRMIEAAANAERRLLVYQPYRLRPPPATIKGILDSGRLGRIFSIKRSVFRFTRRNDWQSLRKNGGGMLNNYGSHYIDQLLYLSGHAEITDIRCRLWAAATLGDADDVVRAWLTTAEGTLLDLEINQASALSLPEWHVCGTLGTLVKSGPDIEVRTYDPAEADPLEVAEGAAPNRSYDNQDRLPWREESVAVEEQPLDFYQNIHDVLFGRAEPYVPIEQTRELMRVIAACRDDSGF